MELAGVSTHGVTNTTQTDTAVQQATQAVATLKEATEQEAQQAVKLVESIPENEAPKDPDSSVGQNVNVYA